MSLPPCILSTPSSLLQPPTKLHPHPQQRKENNPPFHARKRHPQRVRGNELLRQSSDQCNKRVQQPVNKNADMIPNGRKRLLHCSIHSHAGKMAEWATKSASQRFGNGSAFQPGMFTGAVAAAIASGMPTEKYLSPSWMDLAQDVLHQVGCAVVCVAVCLRCFQHTCQNTHQRHIIKASS